LRLHPSFHLLLRALAVSCLLASVILSLTQAQQAPQKPAEKPSAKASTPTEPQNPAQIELLETKIRFEASGDSRKEVHTRVHINSELGVRQFARLNFDYNRSFESIDIPLVRITHPSGGTADILPSAITDNPNPAVVNAPAYQDVRVKSVRILGLAPGDTLEYRVLTTVSHHLLAPDFWLDHSFDRTGVVTQEIFELDLPTASKIQLKINPATPATTLFGDVGGVLFATRKGYRWERTNPAPIAISDKELPSSEPDIALTTFESWPQVSTQLSKLLPSPTADSAILEKVGELTGAAKSIEEKIEALYTFVAREIRTIDLRPDATGFRVRSPAEIVSSGYATSLDKYVLFSALAAAVDVPSTAALAGISESEEPPLFAPSIFKRLLIMCGETRPFVWLDPGTEIAPFRVITPDIRGKPALLVYRMKEGVGETFRWETLPKDLPFPASQHVNVDATLAPDGKLSAKVHYSMRGDNELLLRDAFHESPKEKWKDLAQLLSISDGFRGQVTSVNASDPYATHEPFTVDYEITQPKFVDWSKKPVRIPALLPQLGLPDPPAKPSAGAAASPIELGTPLEVETHMTLHLPPGTTVRTPSGTSVQRDYAAFASQYSAKGPTITASRHIHFLLREVPADRAADYNAFLRAVQSDEAQDFTLDRASTPAPDAKPAAPTAAPPSTPKP
jgi:Domain of Unknown Function with PDB structure (DUF3857)